MPGMKSGQMRAYVLTYHHPEDEALKKLIAYIVTNKLAVYLSPVSGFGRPELRVSPNEFIRGVNEIARFLEEKQRQSEERQRQRSE